MKIARGASIPPQFTRALEGSFRVEPFTDYLCLPFGSPAEALRAAFEMSLLRYDPLAPDGPARGVLLDADISPEAAAAFEDRAGAAVCGFTDAAAVDDAASADSILAYCELPTYKDLRIYQFSNIFEFLHSVGIASAVGVLHSDLWQCAGLAGTAPPDFLVWHDSSFLTGKPGALLLARDGTERGKNGGDRGPKAAELTEMSLDAAREAAKIAEALEKLAGSGGKYAGMKIVYPGSDLQADYKNRRRFYKYGGSTIAVRASGVAAGALSGVLARARSDGFRVAHESMHRIREGRDPEKTDVSISEDENGTAVLIRAGADGGAFAELIGMER